MMDPDYSAPILPHQHMEEEEEEEEEEDPHANYRVDENSYLAIDCFGRYCIQHDIPPRFPQGIDIIPYKRFLGLCQFMVTKPESDDDTVDIVYVGTIMVQNGYAYIFGKTTGVTLEDDEEQLRKKQDDEFRKFIIETKWIDTTLPRILEFRFPRVPSIYPTCSDCGAELSRGGKNNDQLLDRRCPSCGYESLQVEVTKGKNTVVYDNDCIWRELGKHLKMVEQVESASRFREALLEAEMLKCRNEIEELRSKLMDKEAEVQLLKGKAQLDPSHNRKRVTVASLFNDDQGDRLIDDWIGTYKRKKQKKHMPVLRRVGGMLRKKPQK